MLFTSNGYGNVFRQMHVERNVHVLWGALGSVLPVLTPTNAIICSPVLKRSVVVQSNQASGRGKDAARKKNHGGESKRRETEGDSSSRSRSRKEKSGRGDGEDRQQKSGLPLAVADDDGDDEYLFMGATAVGSEEDHTQNYIEKSTPTGVGYCAPIHGVLATKPNKRTWQRLWYISNHTCSH